MPPSLPKMRISQLKKRTSQLKKRHSQLKLRPSQLKLRLNQLKKRPSQLQLLFKRTAIPIRRLTPTRSLLPMKKPR
jgi:hypothetical protein